MGLTNILIFAFGACNQIDNVVSVAVHCFAYFEFFFRGRALENIGAFYGIAALAMACVAFMCIISIFG